MGTNRARKIIKTFTKKRLSLSIAESCTGGLISSLLTDVPGASKCFKGGVVVYTPEAKRALAGIPRRALKRFSEVSMQTTCLLARTIKKRLKSDVGIGITGYLGPSGGTRKHPLGSVYIAGISGRSTVRKKLLLSPHSRVANKKKAAFAALRVIEHIISKI